MPAARRTARSKGSRKNFKQKGLHGFLFRKSECAREPLKNLQSNLASSFRTHGAATPAPGRKKSVSKTGEYRTPDDEEISSLCASQKSGKLRFGYDGLDRKTSSSSSSAFDLGGMRDGLPNAEDTREYQPASPEMSFLRRGNVQGLPQREKAEIKETPENSQKSRSRTDDMLFKKPSMPLSLSLSQRNSQGSSQRKAPVPAFGGGPEKRRFGDLDMSQGSIAPLGSQDFLCTPQDQDIKEKNEFQHAESLQNARVPAKKARISAQSSQSWVGGRGYQASVQPCNVNTLLPLSKQAKRTTIQQFTNERSPFLEGFSRIETIGSGNFGEVIKCRHRVDGCIYAVKRIRKVLSSNNDQNLKEVFTLSALSCQGSPPDSIIRYHNSWIEDEQLYIQLEFCAGGSLSSRLKRFKPALEDVELERVINSMAKALVFLHDEAGIAHLDIKPDNILDAGLGRYKLCDFGLAMSLSSGEPQELKLEGDKYYLPPESLENRKVLLDKIDIFALGITLYELARGKPLKDDVNLRQVKLGKITGVDNRSEKFHSLLRGLLSPDARKRPSASQIFKYVAPEMKKVRELESKLHEQKKDSQLLRRKLEELNQKLRQDQDSYSGY